MRAAGTVGMIGQLPGAGLAAVGTAWSLWRSGTSHSAPTWSWTGLATAIRSRLPDGAPGLIDTAALDALALPAVADGGGLVTLKGWTGPSERGIVIHPVSSFGSATSTVLFDRLRSQVQNGVLTLRVADVLPATMAAEAQRRLAAGGVRGRLVLDFSQPL